MAYRLRIALFLVFATVVLFLAASIVSSLMTSAENASNENTPATQSPGPPIVANETSALSIPESINYETRGTSIDVTPAGSGSSAGIKIPVAAATTGSISVTNEMLTSASLDMKTQGFPTVTFTLTEPCYIGRDGSTAYGTMSVEGDSAPTAVTITASINQDEGVITGSFDLTEGFIRSFPALQGYPTGTITFTLDAHRLGDDPDTTR